MINLLLALAAGVTTAVSVKLFGFSVIAGVIPGTIVFLGLYIVLARRSFTQFQRVVQTVQAELSTVTANQKEQKVKAEKTVKMLEGALPLGKWQFLIEGEVYGQIGMIKFLFKDHEGAMAAFARTSARNYFARAFQASIQFQRKDMGAMAKSFEDAVKAGKKEGLLWAAYAWCLMQNKESDKALKVLARGVEANPSDEKLKKALTDVQNDKRLKMKAWEPMWWQFGLETPPMQAPQYVPRGMRMRAMRGR